MLTKTSETAIHAMVYLDRRGTGRPIPPSQIAQRLGDSPTYTTKVCALLTRAGLLRAHRGMKGGVTLNHPAADITLRAIVEACQGKLLGDYCQESDAIEMVCGFHQAMADLHCAIVNALERWTLADLSARPAPDAQLASHVHCRLSCLAQALANDT